MSNTQNDKKIKISKLKYFYFILVFSILLISGTYAYQYINTTNNSVTGMGGCFNVNYTGQNIATTDLATTTNYQNGSKTTVTLSKHSSCKLYTEANIYLKTNNTTTAPIESVHALKYKVFNSTSQISEGTITTKNDYLLATVPLTDTSTTYTVYLYIDANLSIGQYDGKSYSGYVYAESNQTSTIEGNYLVNFDTNNGENLSLSKTVTNGQPYGWLPTPSKPGYTFVGWNGKNMFNPDKATGNNVNISNGVVTQMIADSKTDLQWKIQTYNNTTYLTTIKSFVNNSTGTINVSFTKDSSFNIIRFGLNGTQRDTLVYYNVNNLNNGTTYTVSFNVTNTTQGSVSWNNIQLEEGSTATSYEPYYVTSSTTVTQTQNHTLTAQYEEKKINVKFDANGGTVNIANKEVTYGSTYGNLPTPTKTGYTFKGWSGKNILSNSDTFDGYSYPGGTLDTTTTLNGSKSIKTYGAWQGPYINLKNLYDKGKIKSGDQVTLSIYAKTNFTFSKNTTFTIYRAYNSYKRINITPTDMPANEWHRLAYTFTIDEDSIASTTARIESDYYDTNDKYYLGNNRQNYIWFARPQLEINSAATEYEPSYVTSSTTVTQDEDHTLTAIWE